MITSIAKGIRRPRDGYFLRAESFFNMATEIERLDEDPTAGTLIIDACGGRSLHEQSHGESLLALMMERSPILMAYPDASIFHCGNGWHRAHCLPGHGALPGHP